MRQHALWRAGPLRTHRHLHVEEKLSDELDLQREKKRERERNKGGEPTDLEFGKKNSRLDIVESARQCVCVCLRTKCPNLIENQRKILHKRNLYSGLDVGLAAIIYTPLLHTANAWKRF